MGGKKSVQFKIVDESLDAAIFENTAMEIYTLSENRIYEAG